MLYAALLFLITLSAQQVYSKQLASTEALTILGGFMSSFLFLFALTVLGNFQETLKLRTGWGGVLLALSIASIAAATVHRVCVTTCILFSLGMLYEINRISTVVHLQAPDVRRQDQATDIKKKRY